MNIRVPVSWLREYLKTDVAAKTIAGYLTTSGPLVERIEKDGEDLIFDIEVTTNRPDAFSIYGLAREAHAILVSNGQKSQLLPPKGLKTNLRPDTSHQLPIDVVIRDKNLCPRFTAIVIDNVKIKPSPAIIRNRLEKSAVRAINNIVDIANYIMLELGQPMHTFDYDKIKGSKMVLRESTEGERIKTIDGQPRKLPTGTIVIEDAERLIDLCGIMGGENSAVSSRTKRVLMFAQSYNPTKIRKTTKALVFRTEAAARFEKGIDLEGILPALSRSIYLAKQTTGAKIASELVDIYPNPQKPQPITLSIEKLNNYLGVKIPAQKAQSILISLGFKTVSSAQIITATPPSWRTQDMEIEEDLIEEVARIYGYHKLPSKLPEGQTPQAEESNLTAVIELKKAFKYLGLTEVLTYSIISKKFLNLSGVDEKDAVELANPLTEEWQFMRPTLLVSLADVIAKNQNQRPVIRIFEIAKAYEKAPSDKALPKQDLKLAIALWPADWRDIKGIVDTLFEILKRNPKFQKFKQSSPLSEEVQSAWVEIGDKNVGLLGIFKREVADYLQIEGQVAVCELNLTEIYKTPPVPRSWQPIAKYPPIIEDISAIFDEKTPAAQVVAGVKKIGEPLVNQVEIIDIYRSPKLGKNKKSITLRLTYQKPTETPTQEEVTRFKNIIIRELERLFKAQVRK